MLDALAMTAAEEHASSAPATGVAGDAEEEQWFHDEEYGWYKKDRVWTMNEIRDHPLFMEDMPRNIEENPLLLALQTLMYEGKTPEQMAEHFKNLGNEAFRMSKNKVATQNALGAYTMGLEQECSDKVLNSQLHSNRAAVSMRMEQWAKAIEDCKKAVELDPTNVKALYRASLSSDALGLTAEAIKYCDAALAHAENEEAQKMRRLRATLAKKLEKEDKAREKERVNDQAVAKTRAEAHDAVAAFLAGRGLRLGPQIYDLTMYKAGGMVVRPTFVEENEAIAWPMIFLYDETGQSDFVEKFDERCCLEDQLQLMFPEDRQVEWDEESKYAWHRLAVYLESLPEGDNEAEMNCVDVTLPLQDALAKVECVAPCLSLHVLVKGTPALAHFCQQHNLPQ